jgi:hypothetical protein
MPNPFVAALLRASSVRLGVNPRSGKVFLSR